MRTVLRRLAILSALALPVSLPTVAEARVTADFDYAYGQMWQAAVRLVRVDLACNVTDRDEDIGFVMFEYTNAGRTYSGSLELVRTTDSLGTEHVRVVVQVPRLPTYVERMIVDRLTRKLRDEFGEPRRVRPARPAPTPPAEEPSETPDDTEETPSEAPPARS